MVFKNDKIIKISIIKKVKIEVKIKIVTLMIRIKFNLVMITLVTSNFVVAGVTVV